MLSGGHNTMPLRCIGGFHAKRSFPYFVTGCGGCACLLACRGLRPTCRAIIRAYGKNDFPGDIRRFYTFVAPANGKATFSGKMNLTPNKYGEGSLSYWFEDSDENLIGLVSWTADKGPTASFSKTSKKLAKGERYTVVAQPSGFNDSGVSSYSFKLTFEADAAKKSNNVTVPSAKVSKTLEAKKLKKKAGKVALPKIKAKYGTPIWKEVKKDSEGVLKLQGKKIVVKKGVKKGIYQMKLRAKVAAGETYKVAMG